MATNFESAQKIRRYGESKSWEVDDDVLLMVMQNHRLCPVVSHRKCPCKESKEMMKYNCCEAGLFLKKC